MIVVVEGPSAAGKTTWCRRHAEHWLPEPGALSRVEIRGYQMDRWRQAIEADAAGDIMVLDGDPFKLYYSWAQLNLSEITRHEWNEEVSDARGLFARGDCGLADVVLYGTPE